MNHTYDPDAETPFDRRTLSEFVQCFEGESDEDDDEYTVHLPKTQELPQGTITTQIERRSGILEDELNDFISQCSLKGWVVGWVAEKDAERIDEKIGHQQTYAIELYRRTIVVNGEPVAWLPKAVI